MGKLNKDFTKLTTFLIGDNVFTGNTATGEWRRCSVAEYNANVADITPAGATPDLTDGIFTFDATTKAWTKVTINEFITNLNNKTTVNASPDIADSMLVIDDATNGLERLTIQEFLTRLGTTVTENTTPSISDGIYIFDGSTKALERLTINQLLTSVATNATENTTPDLADGVFVFDNSTKAWERLSLTQLFTRLGLNVTIGSGTTFADPIIVDDDTQSTSATTGSIQTDGGLGVVKDAYIGGYLNPIGGLGFGDLSVSEIASGAITISGSNIRVESEGSSGDDDLTSISAGRDGQVIILRANNDGRTINVIDGGNIFLVGNSDFALTNLRRNIVLYYDELNTRWIEVSRASVN